MTLPYYAVIFTSILTKDHEGYEEMALKMEDLAKKQPGFLGLESAREAVGVTVSYWESEQAILAWKANLDHQQAQKLGRDKWYASYKIEIARVERVYGSENKKLFPKPE
ncbi:MAG: heme-degrading monooxygenase HmoA [Planctomycetota bacterium]|jgi:heme-degrading monooxygenase HmoA|uniref:antibiotic biosynthesis monooxygenase family protein n=1 Tax=Patiriisocius sp. Uisw_047 TaxID=3230969 RepID=UPI0039EB9B07